MWAYDATFYQIYPMGFCGAPQQNDGVLTPRIRKVEEWIPQLVKIGADAIYFSPVFESDAHGYDTRDYQKLDVRLGTNDDFAAVCKKLHEAGIRVVLDGVFNHVGRGFWAFRDVLEKREASPYRDWFHIDFGGNSNYNDGLWYEGWEGHFELVKLNLRNPEVVAHLFDSIRLWVELFDIDGLRLDVAYCLDRDFVKQLRGFCDSLKPEFYLVGEMLGGDYNQLMNSEMLHSTTNYDCYKGLYSSMNDGNLFEIAHSLGRMFGPEEWTYYKGKHFFNFADNHDVTRLASILNNRAHLPLVYAVLFAMPGIPCLYYGSEWGAEGHKQNGSDQELRPCFDQPVFNELTEAIARMAQARKQCTALRYGSYRNVLIQNKQLIFERAYEGTRVLVAVNIDGAPFEAHFDAGAGRARDLLTGEEHDFGGGSVLEPYSVRYWEVF